MKQSTIRIITTLFGFLSGFYCPAFAADQSELSEMEAGRSAPLLKGNVSKNRKLPHANELKLESGLKAESGELTIDWERWRNRVNKSIWSKFCRLMKGGDALMLGKLMIKYGLKPEPVFLLGTKASYLCRVNDKQEIVDLRLTRSSGIAEFDQLVLDSVRSVAGKNLLKFPAGTKRTEVDIKALLFTTKNGHFQESARKDLELVKEPATEQN